MTESASGVPGTGDEQRTTALPRPSQQTPPPGGQPPTAPALPPQQSPADANATTMLPRPESWPPPVPAPSNLPGAIRGPSAPPWAAPSGYPDHPDRLSPAGYSPSTPPGYPPSARPGSSPSAALPSSVPPYPTPSYPTPSPASTPYSAPPYSAPVDPRGAPERGTDRPYDDAAAGYPYPESDNPPAESGRRRYPDPERRPPEAYRRGDRQRSRDAADPYPPSRSGADPYRGYPPDQDYDARGYPARDYDDRIRSGRRYDDGYDRGDPSDPAGYDDRSRDGRYDPTRDYGEPTGGTRGRSGSTGYDDGRGGYDDRYARDHRYGDGDDRYRDDEDRYRGDDRYGEGYDRYGRSGARHGDNRTPPPGGTRRSSGRSFSSDPASHLPPYQEPLGLTGDQEVPAPRAGTTLPGLPVSGAAGTASVPGAPVPPGTGGRTPRKLTVTRVAALRSRELTHRGIEKFHGAVSADGADRSGLTHLTYAVMANYAVDAALAVALANTLFFAAAKADSTGKVLLYLLLTVAPFAVIAPLIGPLLDRIQSGRRIALAVSSFGRALLALTMALKFDSWVIYPCALGMLVLSKSFGVLKAALTPRVLPEEITLVKTNSRLSVFGLIAGGVAGGVAAGISWLANSPGALIFTAACAVVCGVLCLRIPAWVESTAGEVPVRKRDRDPKQRVFPPAVSATLWTNATIRIETGFLALFIAFVVKSMYQSSSVVVPPDGSLPPPPHPNTGFMQLLLLGAVGAAAGVGGFVGNALGARLTLRNPERVAVFSLGAIILSVIVAILAPGLITAGLVAFVGSTGSSLAKVCLDSVIQRDLPEVNRASAFGRSESVLQLSWVFGGVLGLLIGGVWALSKDAVFVVGFAIIAVILLLCGAQCVAMSMGRSLLPALHLGTAGGKKGARGAAEGAGGARLATPGVPDTSTGASYQSGTSGGPSSGGPAPRRKRTPRKAGDPR